MPLPLQPLLHLMLRQLLQLPLLLLPLLVLMLLAPKPVQPLALKKRNVLQMMMRVPARNNGAGYGRAQGRITYISLE